MSVWASIDRLVEATADGSPGIGVVDVASSGILPDVRLWVAEEGAATNIRSEATVYLTPANAREVARRLAAAADHAERVTS